ncbi:MAG TPA: S1C family serine protease [Candidatus Limnocylindrales bacterium]|jgi:serine protease Do|nr:S1C family serine protease [Candidatus Limnocylindrales bacterium]
MISREAALAFGRTRAIADCRSITFILWLIATVIAAGASPLADRPVSPLSADQTEGQGQPAAPKPQPAPAHPEELAAAFAKTVPTSIADLRSMEERVKALARQLSPSVVAVEVGFGSGSGVVISADGLVLTAGHVCGRPNRDVQFTFSGGRTARGRTLGVDLDSDTGLMRITDPGPWPHAAMGDLSQTHIGDWVLALGHPGGFDLRRSLVIRLGRILRLGADALQTDCTISPGDSGGPLFDMYGRVIGIHSSISSSVAENFHVAITQYYDDWDRLVNAAKGSTMAYSPRVYIGAVGVDDVAGCRLSAIDTDSPALKAGLKVGDLVLKVDGREIRVSASFKRWLAEAEPGETLNLEVKRGEKLLAVNVKLEPLKPK